MELPAVRGTQPTTQKAKIAMSLLQWLHGKQQQQHKERKVQKQIYQQKDSHKERQGGRFNTKRKKKSDIPKKNKH